MSKLARSDFLQIVRDAPLVSIDLVAKSERGRILLGLRNNEPARDCWFVPGGRVLKDETIASAFRRISADELGLARELSAGRFCGVFEHFYRTNAAGKPGFGTHYVVIAYTLPLEPEQVDPPADQHRNYRWWEIAELLEAPDVHDYTKVYFR